MQIFLVTLMIDNGCRKEKWRVIIPEEDIASAIEKAEKIYYRDYAGYEDIIIDSKAQLISTTEYTII